MELKDAIELANSYFLRENNETVNSKDILDAVTHWIFYPGQDGDIEFGLEGVKIEKSSGKMEELILPDDENFRLLDQSTKIKLEEEDR
ncbi:MAG: hypothetical protein IJK24_08270 [Oscillospiraceae bacterium]|nr:hypothetical protein [Oscillospiraceae bacterium]